MDNLHLLHYACSSVKTSTLGKCFPPWTVTRSAWASALRARVSRIATDVMLFSQHGARLIQRYHVFADSVPHQSLDNAPPARKAARAMTKVTSMAEALANAPAFAYRAPMAPAVNLSFPGQPRPTPRMSLPLPQSAMSVPGLTPDPAQSPATQQYPSLPGSRTSTPTYGFLKIDTDVAVSVSLGAAAAVPPTGSLIMARFEPLNLPESQESRLLSVQLSPNPVWPDFDMDTEDFYPLFDTSPDGDLSLISPAATQESISTDSEGRAESFHSVGVSSGDVGINLHHSPYRGAAAPVAAGSSSIVDPGQKQSHPAASTHHGLPRVASSTSARSCARFVSVSVPRGAF